MAVNSLIKYKCKQKIVYDKIISLFIPPPHFIYLLNLNLQPSTMITRLLEPAVIQRLNQGIYSSWKRKRELLSSASASQTDLSTPQPKRLCSQGSVSTTSSTIVPEDPESLSKPTMSLGSGVQQNITGLIELAAPGD